MPTQGIPTPGNARTLVNTLIKPLNAPPRLESRAAPAWSDTLVTLRMQIVGLCRTDLQVASGAIPVSTALVLGHECAGLVVHDPSDTFNPGTRVALNPLRPDGRFIGLHCDGALQEFFQVPVGQLVPAPDVSAQVAAYLEPVAASMAVLNARISRYQKGVIYHANRISHLTYLVLTSMGYNLEWIPAPPPPAGESRYDYAVETVFEAESIQGMLHALKPGGLLVVKSRRHAPVLVSPGLLVDKELTMQAVRYYDFTQAMAWLTTNQTLIAPLLGDTYALADWEQAFAAANSAEARKIFIALD